MPRRIYAHPTQWWSSNLWIGPEWEHLKGHGCWYCPWEKPVVRLSNTWMCFSCLCRAFPGWADGNVGAWLIRQSEQAVVYAEAHTKEALEARFERDMKAVTEWLKV